MIIKGCFREVPLIVCYPFFPLQFVKVVMADHRVLYVQQEVTNQSQDQGTVLCALEV